MKILSFDAYFEPEIAAGLHISDNIRQAYAKAGFDVQIIVPMPTRGVSTEVRNTYKKRKYEEKYDGKVKIYRFSMFREGKNPVQRAFRYFCCTAVQFFKGLRVKNIDLISLGSTPPTKALIAVWLKKLKKIPFIYVKQDVFPDSAVNVGLLKQGSMLWKFFLKIENHICKNADKIIVISEDFKRNIMNKGVPEEKIQVIYNWVDDNVVDKIERTDNKLFDAYQLDRSKFYITYCGNIGLTQNMDMLLEAAKELESYQEICFIMVGDGAYKTNVEKQIMDMNIKNVRLIPFQPYEDIAHVFSLGDVGLIISKENIGQNSVPSKTWSVMSAQQPVLASFDLGSELCDIIKKADCGLCVQAGDKEGLKAAILDFYNYRDKAAQMGRNGRKYILENLTKDMGTSRYVKVIKSFIK